MDNQLTYLLVGGLLLFALVIYFCWKKREGYSNLNDVDNVGSLDTNQYEMIPSAEMDAPAAHFADLVSSGDQSELVKQPPSTLGGDMQPMERLERIRNSQLLPRTSAQATPYNIDVADPVTHMFSVNGPRVTLKSPLYLKADPYRGDIPIRYSPDISLVSKSQYGRESQKLDGFFSSLGMALYNKYTGKSYLNQPMQVVNGETIMDYSS